MTQFLVCKLCPEDDTQFMVPYSEGDSVALALMSQHLNWDHRVI